MSDYENHLDNYNYQNIIEMMISLNPEYDSCECLITDTLFISDDG